MSSLMKSLSKGGKGVIVLALGSVLVSAVAFIVDNMCLQFTEAVLRTC